MPFFEGHPTWTEVFNYMTLPDAVPHSDSASGEKVAGKKLKNVSSCAYYRVQTHRIHVWNIYPTFSRVHVAIVHLM